MILLKLNTSLGITFRGNDQKYQPWVVMNKAKDKIIHTIEDILKVKPSIKTFPRPKSIWEGFKNW